MSGSGTGARLYLTFTVEWPDDAQPDAETRETWRHALTAGGGRVINVRGALHVAYEMDPIDPADVPAFLEACGAK